MCLEILEDYSSDAKLILGDCSKNNLSSWLDLEFWHMPKTLDKNIDLIIEGCKKYNITCVLPTRDGELYFWSKNKNIFEKNGISVLVSDLSQLSLCLDKLMFFQFLHSHKFPVIYTSVNINDISSNSYVVKERFSGESKEIGLDLSHEAAVEFSCKLKNPVFQPFYSGQEISADTWCSSTGNAAMTVMRKRLLVHNGEAVVTETYHDDVAKRSLDGAFNCLKLRGNVMMQAIVLSSGDIRIVECNPRFGGASVFGYRSGVDGLRWSLRELTGEVFNPSWVPEIPSRTIRQVRLPKDNYYDICI